MGAKHEACCGSLEGAPIGKLRASDVRPGRPLQYGLYNSGVGILILAPTKRKYYQLSPNQTYQRCSEPDRIASSWKPSVVGEYKRFCANIPFFGRSFRGILTRQCRLQEAGAVHHPPRCALPLTSRWEINACLVDCGPLVVR